jgi:hypothetical protein
MEARGDPTSGRKVLSYHHHSRIECITISCATLEIKHRPGCPTTIFGNCNVKALDLETQEHGQLELVLKWGPFRLNMMTGLRL